MSVMHPLLLSHTFYILYVLAQSDHLLITFLIRSTACPGCCVRCSSKINYGYISVTASYNMVCFELKYAATYSVLVIIDGHLRIIILVCTSKNTQKFTNICVFLISGIKQKVISAGIQ